MRPKKINDYKLLDLCTEVILEDGPHAFTLRTMAKRVGISPAALIKRFGSKEELLNKCISQHIKKMDSDPLDETIILEEFLSLELKNINNNNFVQNLSLLAADMSEPKLRKIARKYFEGFRTKLHQLITRDSRFSNIEDTSQLVMQIEALFHGSIIQGAFIKNTTIRKNVYSQLSSLIEVLCGFKVKAF